MESIDYDIILSFKRCTGSSAASAILAIRKFISEYCGIPSKYVTLESIGQMITTTAVRTQLFAGERFPRWIVSCRESARDYAPSDDYRPYERVVNELVAGGISIGPVDTSFRQDHFWLRTILSYRSPMRLAHCADIDGLTEYLEANPNRWDGPFSDSSA